MKEKVTYLALGDSYTIGEGVPQQDTFPYQLVNEMQKSGINLGQPIIVAKTGWTTADLQAAIDAAHLSPNYTAVTLLIGVNNQYQNLSPVTYREEFSKLLQKAITLAGHEPSHVFVLSIPDWGLTEFGAKSGRDQNTITAQIAAFNAINKEETLIQDCNYVDTSLASNAVQTNPLFTTADELHPSAQLYSHWVAQLSTKMVNILAS